MDYTYYPTDEEHLLSMEIEILKRKKIRGIIEPTFKALPSQVGLFFDLKDMIPLTTYLKNHSFELERWNIFVERTADVLRGLEEFFLTRNRLDVRIDKVYVDEQGELNFLYYPVEGLSLEGSEVQLFRDIIFSWPGIEERYLAMMTQIVQHKSIEHYHIYGFEESYEARSRQVKDRHRLTIKKISYKAPLMIIGAVMLLLILLYGVVIFFQIPPLVIVGSVLILAALLLLINQRFQLVPWQDAKEQATVLATKEKMILEQLQTGEVIDVESSPFIFGRDVSSHLRFDDPAVSRIHAQIIEHHGYFEVEDLGSCNGTFLNNRRLQRKKHLKEGDEIEIADTRYRVHIQ